MGSVSYFKSNAVPPKSNFPIFPTIYICFLSLFFKNLSSHVCGVFVCLYVCVYWQSLGGGNMGAHYTVL